MRILTDLCVRLQTGSVTSTEVSDRSLLKVLPKQVGLSTVRLGRIGTIERKVSQQCVESRQARIPASVRLRR
jgi:hypothetical protein